MLSLLRIRKSIGFRLFWYDTVTSTNDVLKDMAVKGEAEGAVVIADCQTAGRGRLNRPWISPRGQGLYFSILLRPPLSANIIDFLPIVAAVAVANTIKGVCKVEPQIKWPNDILLSGRKVGGILCETKRRAAALFAVVGIGVNIEMISDEFPVDLRNRSIALNTVSQIKVDKLSLLQAILRELNRVYPLAMQQRQKIIDRWLHFCSHLNKEVVIKQKDIRHTGIFRGITTNGAALIELPTSELVTLASGEFSMEEHIPCF